ncbi:MAG: energy-coupling factor transporter transmembrane component T family protein [Anaerolineae bacterium]
MSTSYDLYQSGGSWLHKLDPRVKLLTVVCGSVILLSWQNLWLVAIALLVTLLVPLSAGISLKRMCSSWRLLWPMMVMIIVFTALFTPGDGAQILSVWIIRVTVGSLAHGVSLALRIAALAFIILSWLFTTDQATLTRSLIGLGLPYAWGLTLAMALRYIPTMASAFRMISDAQQARALELSKGNPLQRARAYLPITVAMLITALRTAEALSRALVSRGYGSDHRRTNWRPLDFRTVDIVWLIALPIVLGVALWARYALGFGAQVLVLFG